MGFEYSLIWKKYKLGLHDETNPPSSSLLYRIIQDSLYFPKKIWQIEQSEGLTDSKLNLKSYYKLGMLLNMKQIPPSIYTRLFIFFEMRKVVESLAHPCDNGLLLCYKNKPCIYACNSNIPFFRGDSIPDFLSKKNDVYWFLQNFHMSRIVDAQNTCHFTFLGRVWKAKNC